MAEVSTGDGGGKGKKRSKKVSTKIDMTPMVDLAFLLITFFMLTTTFNKPKAMEVNMPDKNKKTEPESSPIKASHAITIILGESDKVYWFQGAEDAAVKPEVHVTNFAADGIRRVIRQKNKEIGEKFVVVIKAQDKSKYKNMVDILDEMTITDTKRYAIVDITPTDLELTANL